MEMVEKAVILVVDDSPENIDVLSGLLKDQYKIKAAKDGEKAIAVATGKSKPDLILLDLMMPGIDGYEVCRRLKADPTTSSIPIIFVTAKAETKDEEEGLSLGAVDYITKPVNPAIVKARVKTHLAIADQNRELEAKVKERTKELNDSRTDVVDALGRAAEFKDNETGLHVVRMAHYSKIIAEQLPLESSWVELLFLAAPMHDIGKIGIPDNVLLKPGKLDAEEWETMKKHSEFGAEILGQKASELMDLAREIAIGHHEKWNGKGYPNGISGKEIPLSARIVAIADVFDALTSDRPYKKAWDVDKAVNLIKEEAGEHFDPELAEIFLSQMEKVIEVKEKFAETF